MNIISKSINIFGTDYVLFSDEKNNRVYYGTINKSDIDEIGKLKRRLDGFDMCVIFDDESDYPVAEAVKCRERREKLTEFMRVKHTNEEFLEFLRYNY